MTSPDTKDTLLADGLEDAFIGFFQRINEPRIVVCGI